MATKPGENIINPDEKNSRFSVYTQAAGSMGAIALVLLSMLFNLIPLGATGGTLTRGFVMLWYSVGLVPFIVPLVWLKIIEWTSLTAFVELILALSAFIVYTFLLYKIAFSEDMVGTGVKIHKARVIFPIFIIWALLVTLNILIWFVFKPSEPTQKLLLVPTAQEYEIFTKYSNLQALKNVWIKAKKDASDKNSTLKPEAVNEIKAVKDAKAAYDTKKAELVTLLPALEQFKNVPAPMLASLSPMQSSQQVLFTREASENSALLQKTDPRFVRLFSKAKLAVPDSFDESFFDPKISELRLSRLIFG